MTNLSQNKKQGMKQLNEVFKKNGYFYRQEWRDEDYAIYSQWDTKLIAYEVFKINKNEAHVIFGNDIPASESVPPSTQWGKNAYTVASMERAHELVKTMKEAACQRLVNTNL